MQPVANRDVATARPRRPKPRRRFPAEVLTDPEVRALLDACGGPYHPVALRNRALIALMYRAGLRVSEALGLSPKDVDLETGTVRVLHGKGDVSRTVGLDPGACAVVGRWLAERTRANVGQTGPLLCTASGGGGPHGVRQAAAPALGRAGRDRQARACARAAAHARGAAAGRRNRRGDHLEAARASVDLDHDSLPRPHRADAGY